MRWAAGWKSNWCGKKGTKAGRIRSAKKRAFKPKAGNLKGPTRKKPAYGASNLTSGSAPDHPPAPTIPNGLLEEDAVTFVPDLARDAGGRVLLVPIGKPRRCFQRTKP